MFWTQPGYCGSSRYMPLYSIPKTITSGCSTSDHICNRRKHLLGATYVRYWTVYGRCNAIRRGQMHTPTKYASVVLSLLHRLSNF